MYSNFKNIFHLTILILFSNLIGCNSKNISLDASSSSAPPNVNLSGLWQLKEDQVSSHLFLKNSSSKEFNTYEFKDLSRKQNSLANSLIRLFFETGELLKITQTEFSLFISYDRSIVEEYSFGENRLILVGPIQARRVSGWKSNYFVVETLDESGTLLSEKWHIQNSDMNLVRDIQIIIGKTEIYRNRQFFEIAKN
ncbi:MAG: hypothetical protein CMO97_03750 [Woeseia sp.]|nr:hypothetical protein [Woeseia sp.]|tara:strand:- start:955 stop:1542 length:588 start_codon:yes stop_codon:yes gene_type:complete